jgi:hypothetical protein
MESEKSFNGSFSNYQNEIEAILREYRILSDNYTINEDGSVNVKGDVYFSKNRDSLSELPLNFKKVSGDFNCSKLGLSTLKGSPIEVGGTFNCSYNQLSSLEFAPKKADCFVFDDAVQSLYTNGLNCNYNQVELLYRANLPNMGLPEAITKNAKSIGTIIKFQNFYDIWNDDLSLNKANFEGLLEDILDDLG